MKVAKLNSAIYKMLKTDYLSLLEKVLEERLLLIKKSFMDITTKVEDLDTL